MESPLSGRFATGRLPHSFILPCRPSAKLPLGGTLAEGGKGAKPPFPPPRQLSSDIFNRASGTSRALESSSHQFDLDLPLLPLSLGIQILGFVVCATCDVSLYSPYHWESPRAPLWGARAHARAPPAPMATLGRSPSIRSWVSELPVGGQILRETWACLIQRVPSIL